MNISLTPRQLSVSLAKRVGCLGPGYLYYRTGLASGLAAMRGPQTGYSEADTDGIMRVKDLFQNFTGLDREKNPEWDNNYYHTFLAAHDEWTSSHGVNGGIFSSLLKSLCRPCTNAEIEANLTDKAAALENVLSHRLFSAYLKDHTGDLGFVGSIATGLFGAFSDLDLGLRSGPAGKRYYMLLKDVARTYEIDVFPEAREDRVIWLDRGDVLLLTHQPGYLRQLYFTRNIQGAILKQIDSL